MQIVAIRFDTNPLLYGRARFDLLCSGLGTVLSSYRVISHCNHQNHLSDIIWLERADTTSDLTVNFNPWFISEIGKLTFILTSRFICNVLLISDLDLTKRDDSCIFIISTVQRMVAILINLPQTLMLAFWACCWVILTTYFTYAEKAHRGIILSENAYSQMTQKQVSSYPKARPPPEE